MNESILERYSEIKRAKKELEEEEKALKQQIEEVMQEEGKDREDTSFGTFTMAHRTYWKYTDKVKDLEEKVKLKKVEEEEKGLATPNETVYLVFKEAKEE